MMPRKPRGFGENDYVVDSEEIRILGQTNPVVQGCIAAYSKGDLTWEQAMMSAVKFLATQNRHMFNELVRQANEKINLPRLEVENKQNEQAQDH